MRSVLSAMLIDRQIAFVQSRLRYDYVEGTESSPVGYLDLRAMTDKTKQARTGFCGSETL